MGKLLRKLRLGAVLLYAGAVLVLIAFSLPFTGWKMLSVQTGSMQPSIDPGALVLVHRVSPDSVKQGDVITYKSRSGGSTITHRVLERRTLSSGVHQTLLKGDANDQPDTPVYDEQIVGKVVSSIPFAGKVLDFIKKPLGLVLAVYLPAALIFIYEIRLLVRRLTKLELDKQKKAMAGEQTAKKSEPTPAAEAPKPVVPPASHPAKKKHKPRLIGNMSITLAALLITASAGQTFAHFETDAVVGPNVISTLSAPPPNSDARVLIDKVYFPANGRDGRHGKWKWYTDKNPTTITLFATKRWKKLDARGWTLESSAGQLYKLEGKKWKHWDERTVHIKLKSSQKLNITGDFLVLKDGSGTVIDAVSWGTSTTHLNPSIQGIDPGSQIKRIKHVDTDTAADWRVKDRH